MNAPSNSLWTLNKTFFYTKQIEDFLESFFWNDNEKIKNNLEILKTKQKWGDFRIIDFDDTFYSRTEVLKIKWLKNNRWINWNNWILAKYSWILDEEWERIFWDKKRINYREKVVLDKKHESFNHNAMILGQEQLADFIDSVLSRIWQFSEKDKQEVYWIFCEEFYSKKWKSEKNPWPVINKHEFISSVKWNVNIILTATWAPELSRIKLNESWADNNPYLIVEKSEDKIKSLIECVLLYWFIPKQIIIYEDRPEHFNNYWILLAELLWTKIIVNRVKIDSETNKAEIIEKKVY